MIVLHRETKIFRDIWRWKEFRSGIRSIDFSTKHEGRFAREIPLLSLNPPPGVLPRSLFPRLPPPVKRIVLMVGSFIVIHRWTKTPLIGRPWTLTDDDVHVRLVAVPIKLRRAPVSRTRDNYTNFPSLSRIFFARQRAFKLLLLLISYDYNIIRNNRNNSSITTEPNFDKLKATESTRFLFNFILRI